MLQLRTTARYRKDRKLMIKQGKDISLLLGINGKLQKKYSYAANVTWEMVIESLKRLTHPKKISTFSSDAKNQNSVFAREMARKCL
jgi:hypothetical protein